MRSDSLVRRAVLGACLCVLTLSGTGVARADDACRLDALVAGPQGVLEAGACLIDRGDGAAALTWFEQHAGALSAPHWRAAVDNEQGRIAAAAGERERARVHFERARAAQDPAVGAAASLNLAGLLPPDNAIAVLEEALTRARSAGRRNLEVKALDRLAQAREDVGQPALALALSAEALLPAGQLGREDLLLALQWRRGRLLRATGQPAAALDAYRQAADHLTRIRSDIPVTYADGRSSFRDTFAPIYQGLAELLLAEPGGEAQPGRLREARRAMERIKQSELEDYLGDRCVVERSLDEDVALPPGTAVLYPLPLPDRLELLVQHEGGMSRLRVDVSARVLADVARRFARDLRVRGWTDTDAEALHGWLLAPVEGLLGKGLETLVVVPDGELRLIPFAALKRAGRYVIEDYAVAVAAGLALAEPRRGDAGAPLRALLAGVAMPGRVVDHLPAAMLRSFDQGLPAVEASTREARSARLQQALALPGVRDEIRSLDELGLGTTLLDEAFSLAAFEQALASGRYDTVHIASHGVFGGAAADTFIMAHDDIITIDRLQELLDLGGGGGLDLLTLSACETAEGDDRAPLGLAGAALRARARSALGSLWPVADDATRDLMGRFYRELKDGRSKAQALRAAQLEVLRSEGRAHPFFWSPFILVGDWR